ncbi:MAG: sigma 54-interacting transcriptional regulator [Gammaproteobacteria bacterium]
MNTLRKTTARVLVVDDDQDLLHLINLRLKANSYEVRSANCASNALAQLTSFNPHVVVTDLKMPGMDGMALFEEIQRRNVRTPVIVLTANGTIPDAVEATQKGVFSYLVKPFDAEILLHNLERASSQAQFSSAPANGHPDEWRKEIISCSSAMETLLQQTHAAALSDANLLIQSETGTGKELLAKAIHKASNRSTRPFLALNCAAIPESLIESELFGHSAGSFTGARTSHPGIFKAADGGTVFLDEIGDMPLSAQSKLLRVLEQKEVRPVGATKTVPVNVRIVAATHQNLQKKIQQQEFREDLFYRLDVIPLRLPSLRERSEDIPMLVDYFCDQITEREQRNSMRFAPEAMEALISAEWPGNVRQLYNVIEQCVVLTTTPIIPRALVERALRYKPERLLSLTESRLQFERDYLVKLLNLTAGNIALASRLADRNRSEFYNLLKRHDLEPAQFRNAGQDNA